jgi:hypothetical protein
MTAAYPMDETRRFLGLRFMNYVSRLAATRQTFTFLATMVDQSVLYQTSENAPGYKYFTPMEAGLQRKSQARLSSYQWM